MIFTPGAYYLLVQEIEGPDGSFQSFDYHILRNDADRGLDTVFRSESEEALNIELELLGMRVRKNVCLEVEGMYRLVAK